jgi:hypothetical protein
MRKVTLYQIREFVGNGFSKQLGRRLRNRSDAIRIVKALKKEKREVFAVPMKIAAAA